MTSTIRIATRGSALALWQTNHVRSLLEAAHPSLTVEIKVIKTTGDHILDSPLSQIGGKGVFTKELEESLLAGSTDIAIHSLKDLPTTLPDGLTISAVLPRASVEDAFLSNTKGMTIERLPHGATIATGSLRRKAQLLSLRPDLNIVDIRGNVPTRIEKLRKSTWSGMLLAAAGIERLGLQSDIEQKVPALIILPAPGQGAIAIESRAGDTHIADICKALHDDNTANAVNAEREVLRMLGGGCQVPLGAFARLSNGTLELDACIAMTNGTKIIKAHAEASNDESATQLGARVAMMLIEQGGDSIIESLSGEGFSSLMETM
jgi:hydroxymethylbilane synthase